MIVTESRMNFVSRFGRPLAIMGLLVFFYSLSAAQTSQQFDPSVISIVQQPNPMTPVNKDTPAGDTGSIVEEMRAKRAIKVAEKEYQENVDRARDLSVLSESVNKAFKQTTYLSRDEIKKLEKAEKLAKAIRNAAGGSEDDAEMEQPPKDLACALSTFAEVAEALKKDVEKTPKHVISTAVIDKANVVLELARIIRTLIPNH